ncbi:MAG: hypothetical protein A2031_09995 [Deltaproteobacteria bacterium RBG_19FT_COMBO_43_11]|nr:MAG: hypothetical protein A2031_09995 [Deltaproteobacteria bacterium RBG_19FT_COMBO_43_11]
MTMLKKIIIGLLIVIAIGAGVWAWYYFIQVRPTSIEKIVKNPSSYTGKELVMEGEVTDRTSFFGTPKFYKLKDKSGEIIVTTRKSLPEVGFSATVKGKIDDAFALGNQKLLVCIEESVEKKEKKK